MLNTQRYITCKAAATKRGCDDATDTSVPRSCYSNLRNGQPSELKFGNADISITMSHS